ncbi:unnamed protein product [Onchocerca ochengi]|uniref:Uncharacterized protein n=1 Tax=Onchocerca ochengi TaxID=42157 RepID=A0A182E9S7_ONCOC|nr:unnamed protein product [Onchocerca ochengi]
MQFTHQLASLLRVWGVLNGQGIWLACLPNSYFVMCLSVPVEVANSSSSSNIVERVQPSKQAILSVTFIPASCTLCMLPVLACLLFPLTLIVMSTCILLSLTSGSGDNIIDILTDKGEEIIFEMNSCKIALFTCLLLAAVAITAVAAARAAYLLLTCQEYGKNLSSSFLVTSSNYKTIDNIEAACQRSDVVSHRDDWHEEIISKKKGEEGTMLDVIDGAVWCDDDAGGSARMDEPFPFNLSILREAVKANVRSL